MSDQWKFETQAVHAGAAPDPVTGARQVPIYQTTAYQFRDADHAARLFNLQEVGYIYSRLTNPTIQALQARLAALEGGAGAVCCSSGHAAQIMALFPLMGPGRNLVASSRLYGGTLTQFSHTIRRFGWSAKFVDLDDLDALRAAIDEDTRAVFIESISNPGGYVTDIPAVAEIASSAGVPLIVDNTLATPVLCRPIEMGATLVVHSLTKYMTGNGTVTGGAVIDSGSFDWSASDRFPSLSAPEPAYHGLKFHETFGPAAFTFHAIAIGLRDLGMTLNPQAAHYTLMGIETLPLRMPRHVENARTVAEWLEADPRVTSVTYAGLPSSPYADRVAELYPRGAGALFSFAVRGGYDACVRLIGALKLFSHVANLGDTRSLAIHPASTTHRQLTEAQQTAAGASPDLVRLSIGIEDPSDLIADLDQALTAAAG
ncbi:O-acetylhomoserine aminocarboxypropyltransferase/cysteine synthase [Paracoccus suum]|uniref:O-acetylhomoserine aminocarboxypropyltransferase/cysteine synthase n=1 Tax=Paracoccus suum TaxID=2259340 RepID=A0A344PML9_9RHOB|nr:O-acetylhomoserine aminocarboxypropyltransferase/cysteine synthase family protein [Paracoccus suum]AXC50624.1 O-acetylhomoserine aminocarboxypropyltransferase/cysteine synthase [Paracoccus suum]